MGKLLLLFIVLPAAELWLLIEIGTRLGSLPTLGLVVLTGTLGAYLARWQGLGVLASVRERTSRGEMPAGPLADGVMILVAAALLVTPGIITDAVGFSLLVPAVRNALKAFLLERFRQAVERNHIQLHVARDPHARQARDIDLESGSDPRWIH